MATQGEYTAVANAVMHLIYISIAKLPEFEQNFIPRDKIPTAAGQVAKVAVDALDDYRSVHGIPIPTPKLATKRRHK